MLIIYVNYWLIFVNFLLIFVDLGCGVFDEWRPDLMGTCRPDFAANIIDKDVSVTTPYGRIRGFFVHLFDGPGVALGDRPGPNHYRKLWRTVSTFLGIPYATPPVNEGRFKVISTHCAYKAFDFVVRYSLV